MSPIAYTKNETVLGNVYDVEVENIALNQISFFILGAGPAVFLSYFCLWTFMKHS